jgi:hypothetical protein
MSMNTRCIHCGKYFSIIIPFILILIKATPIRSESFLAPPGSVSLQNSLNSSHNGESSFDIEDDVIQNTHSEDANTPDSTALAVSFKGIQSRKIDADTAEWERLKNFIETNGKTHPDVITQIAFYLLEKGNAIKLMIIRQEEDYVERIMPYEMREKLGYIENKFQPVLFHT